MLEYDGSLTITDGETFLTDAFVEDALGLAVCETFLDALHIDEEAFGVKKEDTLNENKPPRLDTSVIVDALFVKDRAGLGFSETPTDILSAWLDKLGLNDVNSVDDGNTLWVRFVMTVWGVISEKLF